MLRLRSLFLFKVFVVMRPFAADEFRTCPCSRNDCVADSVVCQTNGNRNLFKMHSYHRQSDVDSCVGSDVFKRNGVCRGIVASRGKRTACLRKRNNIYGVRISRCGTLRNYRTVQMLAALCGDKDLVFVTRFFYSVKKSLRCFGA